MNKIIILMVALLALAQWNSYKKITIQADEGMFTVTESLLGSMKIYKETDTTWWIWADEFIGKNRMKVCHNCTIIPESEESNEQD